MTTPTEKSENAVVQEVERNVEATLARVLGRLGIPSREQLQALHLRLDGLFERLKRLEER